VYSGGSVVGKASLSDPEISPSLVLIFTGVKSAKFDLIFTSLDFEPPASENAARYLKHNR